MQPTPPGRTQGPELRYVAAGHLSSSVLDLDGRELTGSSGEALGRLDGFLVDTLSGRPEFIVVGAGDWHGGRRYLVPADHARFDPRERALSVDFGRDAVARFPAIDDRRIEALRHDELGRYREEVTRACCPDDEDLRRLDLASRADATSAWWNATGWMTSMVPGAPTVSAGGAADERMAAAADRERWASSRGDREGTAPTVGERAQPGDVIGIESGGETTSIGETAEDEDRRRERAERDLQERRSPERDRR